MQKIAIGAILVVYAVSVQKRSLACALWFMAGWVLHL